MCDEGEHKPELTPEQVALVQDQIRIIQERLEISGLERNLLARFIKKLKEEQEFKNAKDAETARSLIVQAATEIFRQQTPEEWRKVARWERAKAGDHEAFTGLRLQHNPDVLHSIRKCRIWQPHDCDEVSQNVWIKVLENLPGAEGPELAAYVGWLKTIAFHESINWLRKERDPRKPVPVTQLAPADRVAEMSMDALLITVTKEKRFKSVSPESLLDYRTAVEKLLEPDRTIWEMHCQGYIEDEIAAKVHLSQSAVSVRLSKLKRQFEVLL